MVHTVNRDDSNQLTNIKISYHTGNNNNNRPDRKHLRNSNGGGHDTGLDEDDDSIRSQGGVDGVAGGTLNNTNPHLQHNYDP